MSIAKRLNAQYGKSLKNAKAEEREVMRWLASFTAVGEPPKPFALDDEPKPPKPKGKKKKP